MASSLPPELVNLITNHLKSDKKALKACCYLGPIWFASCHHYLFSSTFTAPLMHRGRIVEQLTRFLQSSPFISSTITKLCVTRSASRNAAHTINVHTVSTLLNALPRLQVLSLQYLDYGSSSKHLPQQAHFKLGTLRLKCRAMSSGSTRTFLEILSLFSELDVLHLEEHPYLVTPDNRLPLLTAVDRAGLHMPTIRAVLLERRRFFMWMLLRRVLSISPGVLRKISVPMYGDDDLKCLWRALHMLGPQLEELELQIARWAPIYPMELWRWASLESLSTMHTFTVIYDTYEPRISPLCSMVNALRVIPSGNLQHVNLVFSGLASSPMLPAECNTWMEFEAILGRFPKLASVTIWQNEAEMSQRMQLANPLNLGTCTFSPDDSASKGYT